MSDQDFIHNGKKLVNHLKHPSKVLYLGDNLCHMNHLQLLYTNESFNQHQHGLYHTDIERKDCMNWESAQHIVFPKVPKCLQKINDGDILPKENVSGTIMFLHICWRYVEIFYSLESDLLQRIKNASFVVNMLRIWRNWV